MIASAASGVSTTIARPQRPPQRSSSDRDTSRDGRDYERDRGFMFDDQDRNREPIARRIAVRGRGFFERSDQARSWIGDDDRHERSDHGAWENNGDWPQRNRGMSGSNEASRGRTISNHPDDHYRSWRDRQMQALDRDYADYCREREQQFHSEFDSWRQNGSRRGRAAAEPAASAAAARTRRNCSLPKPVRATGSTAPAEQMTTTPSPEGEATLGTNNPANAGTGRGGRR